MCQPSLFVDTPLDLRLKTMGIDTLVIVGVATDIGVEFTCRHAAALGYCATALPNGNTSSMAVARSEPQRWR